tara:strand:+ start:241 stop:642 length:402 start_codon:yes stop_codon:yes gene_type:complete
VNIKLLLRIYAGLMAVFTLGALFSAESMMESFGMSYTTEAGIILQFAMLGQVIFIVLTLQIINWLGDDLHKVGCTYAVLSVLPVLVNSYQVFTELVPMTSAFYVEQAIWIAFAALFFVYSKENTVSTDANSED